MFVEHAESDLSVSSGYVCTLGRYNFRRYEPAYDFLVVTRINICEGSGTQRIKNTIPYNMLFVRSIPTRLCA